MARRRRNSSGLGAGGKRGKVSRLPVSLVTPNGVGGGGSGECDAGAEPVDVAEPGRRTPVTSESSSRALVPCERDRLCPQSVLGASKPFNNDQAEQAGAGATVLALSSVTLC
jgi:hypothetical protein